jgi:spore coat polysaccharide biosynthesis predicted glycosyltransferase SpsG
MAATSIHVVSIRADCNAEIGYGHVMRCLSVAKALCRNGAARTRFLMTKNSDAELVENAGFEVLEILGGGTDIEEILIHASPEDGPLLLDSYAFNAGYLEMLRQTGYRVAIFDDGNRLDLYQCDMVVDSAPEAASLAYHGLPETRFCLGSDYFPLHPEFIKNSRPKAVLETPKIIVVTFGGSDHDDITLRVLDAMAGIDGDFDIITILGPAYSGQAEDAAGNDLRVRLHRNVTNMSALLGSGDIAVSGGGNTASELAFLGAPMVLLALSPDQASVAEAFSNADAAIYLGFHDRVEEAAIAETLRTLIGDHGQRQKMSRAGRALIDGRGADRIANAILGIPAGTIGIAS